MDVYILNLIFTNQKKSTKSKKPIGIHFKELFPIVLQDNFLNIKSKSGVYSAIERMKKNKLIEITRIKKIPPEIIISLTKKGLDELSIFSGIISKDQLKVQSQALSRELSPELSQDRIQELTKSLELSQEQIQELSRSLKLSQDQSKSLKQSLNKSQVQVKKLTESLEILKSQKTQKTQESHSKNKQVQKEVKGMGDAERADLIQSVVYKIIDAMDMDYDELDQTQSERVENIAEKIVDQIRE